MGHFCEFLKTNGYLKYFVQISADLRVPEQTRVFPYGVGTECGSAPVQNLKFNVMSMAKSCPRSTHCYKKATINRNSDLYLPTDKRTLMQISIC